LRPKQWFSACPWDISADRSTEWCGYLGSSRSMDCACRHSHGVFSVLKVLYEGSRNRSGRISIGDVRMMNTYVTTDRAASRNVGPAAQTLAMAAIYTKMLELFRREVEEWRREIRTLARSWARGNSRTVSVSYQYDGQLSKK